MTRLLALTLTFALAACTGSLFKDKTMPPAVYLLSATTGTPGPQVGADLTILKPRVRAGLNSDRIAALYPDRRLDYFAGARWSGPLDEVVQDLAVQSFHAQANLRNVSADASAFAGGYWLEIEVIDFQAEYAPAATEPTVYVHFLARIGTSGDRRILGQFETQSRQAAPDNRLTAIVAAYERAADAALGEIVSDAMATLSKNL
jgi:cholesterol transport system auxiliary component